MEHLKNKHKYNGDIKKYLVIKSEFRREQHKTKENKYNGWTNNVITLDLIKNIDLNVSNQKDLENFQLLPHISKRKQAKFKRFNIL